MSATPSPSSSPTPIVQAKDAAEKIVVDYGVLARRRRHRDRRQSRPAAGARRLRPTTPSSTGMSATRARRTRPSPKAAHVTKFDLVNNRLIPNAIEPRAALGEYDSGTDVTTLYTTSQNPHVARSGALRVSGHRAREQAARHRAGRRRRLRLEDLHLQRRDRLRLGGQKDRPTGQVDGRTQRVVP